MMIETLIKQEFDVVKLAGGPCLPEVLDTKSNTIKFKANPSRL